MGNHPNERCDERGGGSVVELEDILNRSTLLRTDWCGTTILMMHIPTVPTLPDSFPVS